MDIVPSRTGRTVERLYCETDSGTETVPVEPSDLVFVTNGSMTDGSSIGSMDEAPNWTRQERHSSCGNPLSKTIRSSATRRHSRITSKRRSGSRSPSRSTTPTCSTTSSIRPGKVILAFLLVTAVFAVVAAQPHVAYQPDD